MLLLAPLFLAAPRTAIARRAGCRRRDRARDGYSGLCTLCHFDQAARSPRRLAKVYADDIATIHLRKQNALHTIEPAVDAKAK